MAVRLISNMPAVFITDKKILVIADLHIGLEKELYEKGIVIRPQAEIFKQKIDELIKMTNAKILVILGDIKHEVPGISYREEKEIPKLFDYLAKKIKVICCKGNHDTYLNKILPKNVKITSSKGLRIGKYGFFHGHAWPSKKLMLCDYLLMAHIHPVIEFKDKFGYKIIEQVWIKGNLNKSAIKQKYKIEKTGKLQLIIVPSFNKLVGGAVLNSELKNELIGPILSKNFFNIDKSKAYLLDGTFLGKIEILKF